MTSHSEGQLHFGAQPLYKQSLMLLGCLLPTSIMMTSLVQNIFNALGNHGPMDPNHYRMLHSNFVDMLMSHSRLTSIASPNSTAQGIFINTKYEEIWCWTIKQHWRGIIHAPSNYKSSPFAHLCAVDIQCPSKIRHWHHNSMCMYN